MNVVEGDVGWLACAVDIKDSAELCNAREAVHRGDGEIFCLVNTKEVVVVESRLISKMVKEGREGKGEVMVRRESSLCVVCGMRLKVWNVRML